jgi:hypothetical protein
MKYRINELVYPEGERMETALTLSFNSMVDINGQQLRFPLNNLRIIAYTVYMIKNRETQNELITEYHLKLLSLPELQQENSFHTRS